MIAKTTLCAEIHVQRNYKYTSSLKNCDIRWVLSNELNLVLLWQDLSLVGRWFQSLGAAKTGDQCCIKDRSDTLLAYHSRDFIGYIVSKFYWFSFALQKIYQKICQKIHRHVLRLAREWTLHCAGVPLPSKYCVDTHHHTQGQSRISGKIKWRWHSVIHKPQSVTSDLQAKTNCAVTRAHKRAPLIPSLDSEYLSAIILFIPAHKIINH